MASLINYSFGYRTGGHEAGTITGTVNSLQELAQAIFCYNNTRAVNATKIPNVAYKNVTYAANSYGYLGYCTLSGIVDEEELKIFTLDYYDTTNSRNSTVQRGLFDRCVGLYSLDISGLDLVNCTLDYSYLFAYCNQLSEIIGIENLSNKTVKNASYMFLCCGSLQSITLTDLTFYDNAKIEGIFNTAFLTSSGTYDLGNLSLLNVDNWHFSTILNSGFNNVICYTKLINLDLST